MGFLFNKISPIKIFLFIAKHGKCNNCGSKLIGNGEGAFVLTEGVFRRYCKCGNIAGIGFDSNLDSARRRKVPYL